jgi:hypothetical protein
MTKYVVAAFSGTEGASQQLADPSSALAMLREHDFATIFLKESRL